MQKTFFIYFLLPGLCRLLSSSRIRFPSIYPKIAIAGLEMKMSICVQSFNGTHKYGLFSLQIFLIFRYGRVGGDRDPEIPKIPVNTEVH